MSDKHAGKRYRVIKMVEARRLNPNSGIPLSEPPTPMPFGAILENLREDRDLYKFTYLGKPYQCPIDILKPAMEVFKPGAAAEGEAEEAGVQEEAPLPPAAPAPAAGEAQAAAGFQWETVATSHGPLLRGKVPGGWLVMNGRGGAMAFYPDARHEWDGRTL